MLNQCQYTILDEIRKRTDANYIDGYVYNFAFLTAYNRDDIWKFLMDNDFIDKGKEGEYSTVTFPGRIALATYEEANESP